jgi:putative N6-adenine-specific DNA methylase/tRNA (guanine6-N2)-methyltransferase
MTELHFTTNPGLEDVAAEEFGLRLRAAALPPAQLELRPWELDGHVLVRHPDPFERLWPVAARLRSIHHLLRPLHSFVLHLQAQVRRVDVPGLAEARSFRVTSRRTGQHGFTSLDLQREAGAVLLERYGRPVDLDDPGLEVRVDVHGTSCLVAVQLTPEALSRRHLRPYRPRAVLRANVAYALLHLARLEGGSGVLLDPFCGSGTILLEAAEALPDYALCGSDRDPVAVEGARRNLEAAGLTGRVQVRQVDARRLAEEYPAASLRAIVTNPPYGVRLGQQLDFAALYRRFLDQAGQVLEPGGRLALLAWRQSALERAARAVGGFRQLHLRVVETGGIYPRLFVLERT